MREVLIVNKSYCRSSLVDDFIFKVCHDYVMCCISRNELGIFDPDVYVSMMEAELSKYDRYVSGYCSSC